MDKPIPEAVVHAFVDWLAKEMPPGTYISSPQWWASRIIRQIEFLTAAQQQGQAVAWMTPGAIAHLAKQNGPAKVDAWNCASGADRVPLYAAPPSAPVGVEAALAKLREVLGADGTVYRDVQAMLLAQQPAAESLADTQRAIIEAAERRGYEWARSEQPAANPFVGVVCPECNAEYEATARQPAAVDGARPLDDWHEDEGPVVWWKLPVDEPAWIGTPLDSDWPGYHTHWTPHPAAPATQHQEPTT